MKTIAEHTTDKSAWGPGPWQEEPDKVQWLDEASGLPCLAVRNEQYGNWCGYVGVSAGHPLYEVEYDSPSEKLKAAFERRKGEPIGSMAAGPVGLLLAAMCDGETPRPDSVFEVHGCLTYSGHCSGRICHAVEPGEDDRIWWFGYDCGHCDDFQPGMEAREKSLGLHFGPRHGKYRDLAYVEDECRKLARQLKDLKP